MESFSGAGNLQNIKTINFRVKNQIIKKCKGFFVPWFHSLSIAHLWGEFYYLWALDFLHQIFQINIYCSVKFIKSKSFNCVVWNMTGCVLQQSCWLFRNQAISMAHIQSQASAQHCGGWQLDLDTGRHVGNVDLRHLSGYHLPL